MAEWYTRIAGNVTGPHTTVEIIALAGSGRLTASDKVLKGTDGKWTPAGQVKGLTFGAPQAAGDDIQFDSLAELSSPASAVADAPPDASYREPTESTDAANKLRWYASAFRYGAILGVALAVISMQAAIAAENKTPAWLAAVTCATEAFLAFTISCTFNGFAEIVDDSRRQVRVLVELVNRTERR